jgi:hypothetical protein
MRRKRAGFIEAEVGWLRLIRSRYPEAACSSPLRTSATTSPKLPKAEHEVPKWQAAMEALILATTQNEHTILARIVVIADVKVIRNLPY